MKKNQILLLLLLSFSTMAFSQWQGTNPVYFNAGNVGIGTASPGGKLEINYAGGQLRLSGGTVAAGLFTSTADLLYLADWNTGSKGLIINMTNGNVGIGTPTLSSNTKLEVVGPATGNGPTIRASGGGDLLLNGGGTLFFDGNYSYAAGNYIRPVAVNTQAFFTSGAERMRITATGSVGIGTNNTGTFKLAVEGKIGAREVNVTTTTPWPDYVFEKDYSLPSLEEVKKYIALNKHLPEVPSAKEVEANGVNLGEMNMLLLKKIEELTLYVIELKKSVEKLQNDNQELRSRVDKIENKN
jgi:hypothetical protein